MNSQIMLMLSQSLGQFCNLIRPDVKTIMTGFSAILCRSVAFFSEKHNLGFINLVGVRTVILIVPSCADFMRNKS